MKWNGNSFKVTAGSELHTAISAEAQRRGITRAGLCRILLSAHFNVEVYHPPIGKGGGRPRDSERMVKPRRPNIEDCFHGPNCGCHYCD